MARFSGVTAQGRGRSKSGRRGDVRPGGVRTQRYGESVRDMRGAFCDPDVLGTEGGEMVFLSRAR